MTKKFLQYKNKYLELKGGSSKDDEEPNLIVTDDDDEENVNQERIAIPLPLPPPPPRPPLPEHLSENERLGLGLWSLYTGQNSWKTTGSNAPSSNAPRSNISGLNASSLIGMNIGSLPWTALIPFDHNNHFQANICDPTRNNRTPVVQIIERTPIQGYVYNPFRKNHTPVVPIIERNVGEAIHWNPTRNLRSPEEEFKERINELINVTLSEPIMYRCTVLGLHKCFLFETDSIIEKSNILKTYLRDHGLENEDDDYYMYGRYKNCFYIFSIGHITENVYVLEGKYYTVGETQHIFERLFNEIKDLFDTDRHKKGAGSKKEYK